MRLTSKQRPLEVMLLLSQGLAGFLLVAFPAAGQYQPAGLAAHLDRTAEEGLDSPKAGPTPQPATSSERLFYAMPNYLTVQPTWQVHPLSPAKKFELVGRNTFDYVEFPWYAVQAGIRQAHDSQPEYGQGAEGYGKRYALTFADCTVENFMVGAVLPSVLRQDPRYYREGRGRSNWRRMSYAMSRIFVTRGDSGRTEFNFSEIVGSAVTTGISNYGYHPLSDHNLQKVVTGWGTQMAFHTFSLVMKEFWPDIRMRLSGSPH